MRTLYVSDLDGTLLNGKSRISEASLCIINTLVEQGMLFTYATARSLVSARVATRGLSTRVPVIAYNGAFIFDAASGQPILREELHPAAAQQAMVAAQALGVQPMVYAFVSGAERLSWLQGHENPGMLRYLRSRPGDPRLRPVKTQQELSAGEIFYLTLIGDEAPMTHLHGLLQGNSRLRCTLAEEPACPGEYWCECMPPHATKAHAIQKLQALWQCDRIVSFGDGLNDLPMFRLSDECYAVANAHPAVKRAATGVIASNEEDGVAHWLQNHVFLDK